MELAYPWVLLVAVVVAFILVLVKVKPFKFKQGNKVANTDDVTLTATYKKLFTKYKIYRSIMLVSLMLALASGFVLGARIISVDTIYPKIHNRDIFLCLDVSNSVDDLNLQIVDEYIELVKKMDGERFGITIFNARPILQVPLTMDYDYVIEQLELAKRAFKKSSDLARRKKDFSRDIDPELYSFKYDGTLAVGGSSYIGDGLYSSLTHFGELKGNTRSKIIILATDNWVNGSPNITIEEATEYCKRNNVKVYGIAPKEVVEEEQFKKGVESTGGKYYHVEDTGAVKDIISEIEKTQKSDLSIPQTLITDYPKVPFFCLIVFMGIYFWISKRIRL